MAQDNGIEKHKLPKYIPKTKPFSPQDLLLRNDTINFQQKFSLGKVQPGIYFLPQDNMPCKVPDTNEIATIPNPSPITIPFKSHIPNPLRNDKKDGVPLQQPKR